MHCPKTADDTGDEFEDVVVEFEGNFDIDAVLDKDIQMIGIDSEEPVLKIDAKFYKIDVKDSIGTKLLFRTIGDDKGEAKLDYHGKTDKTVVAHRVMVKPK